MALRGVIREGDPTSSGGRVISASGTQEVTGKRVAVQGDHATCPFKGHGWVVVILEGSSAHTDGGKPIAYDGCRLSCGCCVISTVGAGYCIETDPGSASQSFALDSPPDPRLVARTTSDEFQRVSTPLWSLDSATGSKVGSTSQSEKTWLIAIDPGHGDRNDHNHQVDPGCVNGTDYEKDLALAIALSLSKSLKNQGFEAVMTRRGDIENAGTKLQWRLDLTEGADLLVSIHINSSVSASAHGFSVCYNPRHDGSREMAQSIATSNTSMENKGISPRTDLFLLNKFHKPAALVEAGYISNEADLIVLKTRPGLIGQGIASGIMDFIRARS